MQISVLCSGKRWIIWAMKLVLKASNRYSLSFKPSYNSSLPKTVKQLRRFNGMMNFYGKFHLNGVKHLAPLYAGTSGKSIVMDERMHQSVRMGEDGS